MKALLLSILCFGIIGFSQGQTQKTTVVEHFTNTRCSVCAIKNPSLYSLLQEHPEVIHIAYHPSSPYSSCIFSQHNPSENDARTQYYGIYGGTPRVVLSGTVIPVQSPMLSQSQLEADMEDQSDYQLDMSLQSGSGNSQNINVSIEKVSDDDIDDLSLYVILVEREVAYAAPNGENLHHDVFRVELANESLQSLSQGEVEEFSYSYSPDAEWQAEEMYAIAILSSQGSKEVLQAAKSVLAGSETGISSKNIEERVNLVSPNPFANTIKVHSLAASELSRLTVYNLYGQKIFESKYTNTVQTDQWPKGMYIIEIEDDNGNRYSSKIQKQ